MALLNFTDAARVAGVHRSTIIRHVKSGKISASTDSDARMCIDTEELLRVFGKLKSMHTHARAQDVADETPCTNETDTKNFIDFLKEQLQEAKEREKLAAIREQELLMLLKKEQEHRQIMLPSSTRVGFLKKIFK